MAGQDDEGLTIELERSAPPYTPSGDPHEDVKCAPNRCEDPIRRVEGRFPERLVPAIDARRRNGAANSGYR